jgi:hypothetical protein
MNRFCLKPKVNPVFKMAQPLPALIAIPGLKPPGTLPGRVAVPLPPTEGRLDLPAMGLDEKGCDAANEPSRYNSLCKNFAFTNLSQVV